LVVSFSTCKNPTAIAGTLYETFYEIIQYSKSFAYR